MDPFLLSTIYGCIAGAIGTGLGGVIACFLKPSNSRLLSRLMGLSAGIMLAVVLFSLIPESLEMGNLLSTIIGMILGAVFIAITEKFLSRRQNSSKIHRMGTLLFAGIALHNVPEGLAIGAGLSAPGEVGIVLALLIMIHNIPEGLSMAIPVRMEGKNPILRTILAGLPTALGAAIGIIIGNVSPMFIGGAMAFAAGAMAYLTLVDLLPESASVNGYRSMLLSALIGLLLGAALIFIL